MSGRAAGPGTSAATAGRSSAVGTFLRSPLDPATWRAALANFLGFWIAILAFGALSTCFSTGGSLLIWLIGIPIVALGIEFSRLVARTERWRMTWIDGRPLQAHTYRPLNFPLRAPYGPWIRAWAEAEFLDANRWRDVIYVLVLFPLAMLEFLAIVTLWVMAAVFIAAPLIALAVGSLEPHLLLTGFGGALASTIGIAAVLIGVVLVPVAAWSTLGVMRLHRAVVEGLLCVSPAQALRQDVERLRGSRSAALEMEASELRRIERDLHDGTQQRLVALAIDLGLAEERVDADPAAAKVLVASAREQARQALTELRSLVRGTAPAILLDRGLVAALAAVAGNCPVPTVLDSSLPSDQRLPPAVERAAYFVVAESLANVAKHSAATQCDIGLGVDGDRLIVEVRDDGNGGALVAPGGGLAGLRDRAEALDGTLEVSSPPGGPTVIRVTLPTRPDQREPAPANGAQT